MDSKQHSRFHVSLNRFYFDSGAITRVCVCFFFIRIVSVVFSKGIFRVMHRHCVSQLIAKSQSFFFYKVKVGRDQCVGGDILDKVKKIYCFYFGGVYVFVFVCVWIFPEVKAHVLFLISQKYTKEECTQSKITCGMGNSRSKRERKKKKYSKY